MMYHMQPWMILGLLPLSIAFEGIPISTSEKVFRYRDVAVVTRTLTCVFVGSMLAFLMELTEYLLLRYTSSLTLSITGIIKEIFTLYLAIHYNGDSMTTMNYIGLVICVLGIGTHVFLKALHVSGSGMTFSYIRNRLSSCFIIIFNLLPSTNFQMRKRSYRLKSQKFGSSC
ncbi:solute carrier family 35 member C2-like isoform X1 [Centruroides sculpturatus]|uniref:solute carrier family 35 member C2-like isoform X1 n=1 Tax=Centruroides sculpturatus TaxID=218467 RepID=UPI000C6D11AA|nr:solute carrier family 35 member C2-like isoform X1 [Centruroides sculpturatus]